MDQTRTRLTRATFRSQRAGKRRYITGFDGLRTLAVLGVIIYHLAPSSMQGGYLGVPIFFLISGYLVTYLLIQEWETHSKRVAFLSFYGRRVKRLYPALVTMILGTTAYITLFQRSLLVNIRGTIVSNLTYLYNWFEINHGQSYFDRFNGESPFTHLWTLSIEGQFYLVWPLVVVGLLLLFRSRVKDAIVLMVGAILSAIAMGLLYDPTNLNRVYYGTDTRMFAILIGAAMAFIWPAYKLRDNISQTHRFMLDGLGLLALAGTIYLFFTMNGQAASTYRGGMFWFTMMSAILVATVAHPGSDMNRILSNKVFSYVGKRSYGIYLYQFPVMIFYEARVHNIGNHPLIHALIEVALIMVVTELSYRFVENPVRHYQYRQLGHDLWRAVSHPLSHRATSVLSVIAVACFALTAVGFVQQPAGGAKPTALQKTITKRQAAAQKQNSAAAKKQRELAKAQAKAKREKHDKAVAFSKMSKKDQKTAKYYFLNAEELTTSKQTPLTAVGDSVLLDDSGDLQEVFPGAVVNGEVGRQASAMPGVISSLSSRGQLAKNVLVNIGTNGNITQDQADQIVHGIGKDHQIFWVTAHVPTREWQHQVNAMIHKTAKKYPNVHVIDWYTTAKDHSSWFVKDNVHPNDYGNRYFTSLIAKTITKQLNQ
ncbi:acyltransferase family protein [Levilactobacillus suantsaii]|uniref:Acetyltransferase n=1 Tax=Levilactobacillus suantsaii TaxID=2292255 RepID=A0A4Q0VJE8_9LACO|nr:acyltransferase family protein [Levilactobacillus suantsaii]RXI78211.1 acetyltransferase [Levilactobacillus suantsaii]